VCICVCMYVCGCVCVCVLLEIGTSCCKFREKKYIIHCFFYKTKIKTRMRLVADTFSSRFYMTF